MWSDIFFSFTEALVEKGVRGVAELVPGGGVAFDVIKGTIEKVKFRRKLAKLGAIGKDMEAMVQAAPEEIKKVAFEAVEKMIPKELEHLRPIVQVYLEQIPAVTRQSLKRPDDMTGRSVPKDFRLESAEDLQAILPKTWPRFKPGDALPGRDPNDWLLDRPLGTGGFGEVWLARSLFGAPYMAVKFLNRRDLDHEGNIIKYALEKSKELQDIIVPVRDRNLQGDLP